MKYFIRNNERKGTVYHEIYKGRIMKKIISNSTFCYIMAVIFYIVAIVDFVMEKESSTPITWLCFGSMWVCISTVYKEKPGKDDKDNKK